MLTSNARRRAIWTASPHVGSVTTAHLGALRFQAPSTSVSSGAFRLGRHGRHGPWLPVRSVPSGSSIGHGGASKYLNRTFWHDRHLWEQRQRYMTWHTSPFRITRTKTQKPKHNFTNFPRTNFRETSRTFQNIISRKLVLENHEYDRREPETRCQYIPSRTRVINAALSTPRAGAAYSSPSEYDSPRAEPTSYS